MDTSPPGGGGKRAGGCLGQASGREGGGAGGPDLPARGQPLSPHKGFHRGPFHQHRRVDPRPRKEEAKVSTPIGGKTSQGPRPPTYSGSARPPATGAGGAAAARGRHAITFSSGAGGGPPRFEGCGRVEKDCEWESPRAPSVCLLFRDTRATPAVLEFLRDTRVGRMPGLALLGVQEEESELEEIELVAQSEGPGSDSEKDGPGPP